MHQTTLYLSVLGQLAWLHLLFVMKNVVNVVMLIAEFLLSVLWLHLKQLQSFWLSIDQILPRACL